MSNKLNCKFCGEPVCECEKAERDALRRDNKRLRAWLERWKREALANRGGFIRLTVGRIRGALNGDAPPRKRARRGKP